MNLLTVKQVSDKLSCAQSYVWKMLKEDPTFPKPINIGMGKERARGTRWIDGAMTEWLLTKQQMKNNEVHTNENGRTGKHVHQSTGEEIAA